MPKRIFGPDEPPAFLVRPSDNVYSYFMFISPTEAKKEGKGWTWDILIGYMLVSLNFVLQGILLYTVFNTVVLENVEWQDGIMKIEAPVGIFSRRRQKDATMVAHCASKKMACIRVHHRLCS